QTRESCVHEKKSLTCTSITSQYADVSLPLKVKPYAIVGKLEAECCGEPIVAVHPCQGANCSCGCEITITQTVCIRIPVEYGADANTGDITAVCKRNQCCPNTGTNTSTNNVYW
ncbi:MAG: hypothetical protein RR396_04335, partial [Clostridiales bacterium]